MTLEAKKELLKYKILNDRYFHDVITYKILRYNYFNNVIEKISDMSFYNNIDVDNNEINANQFIDLLKLFIKTIKKFFFNPTSVELVICGIIEDNIDMMDEYLSLKYKVNDDKHIKILEEKIYKIIISNFIDNATIITSINTFLEENSISIKPINDYSYSESSKILHLLSDLVFCQRGREKYTYLFENINSNLSNLLERQARKKSKYDIDYYKEKYINRYISNYEFIFKSYNSKKKYLKYFN